MSFVKRGGGPHHTPSHDHRRPKSGRRPQQQGVSKHLLADRARNETGATGGGEKKEAELRNLNANSIAQVDNLGGGPKGAPEPRDFGTFN